MKFTKNMQSNSGSSLLYVILMLGIMFVISFSVSALSISELNTVQVNQRSQKAFYLAEAGAERALYEESKVPGADLSSPNTIAVGEDSYTYGLVSGGSIEKTQVTLSKNTSGVESSTKKIYLFDPNRLQDGSYATTSGTTVSFRCVSCSANNPAPGLDADNLEVTLYSFDPANVSSFDTSKLTSSKTTSFDATDESNIKIDTHYFQNMSAYTAAGTAGLDVTGTSSLGNELLYMIELHSVQQEHAQEIYEVSFSHAVSGKNSPTIRSVGQVNNSALGGDARRALEVTFSQTNNALDVFGYTLFDGGDIDKFAL